MITTLVSVAYYDKYPQCASYMGGNCMTTIPERNMFIVTRLAIATMIRPCDTKLKNSQAAKIW